MRVIAGKKRGLLLDVPKGMTTRPTSDRIKETLFNILQNDLYGSRFLDLFSGSGQIGIEALSRGAAFACFVEQDKKAYEVIERNIKHTDFLQQSELRNTRVEEFLKLYAGDAFDIIFMDPPYFEGYEKTLLETLSSSKACDEDSIVILEADLHTELPFAEELGFEILRVKKYKTNQHYFLRKK